MHSNNICLLYLSKQFQYNLLYEYSVCETYVWIFEDCHNTDLWTFKINLYFLCELKFSEIFIKIKSDTVKVRILFIDKNDVQEFFFDNSETSQ